MGRAVPAESGQQLALGEGSGNGPIDNEPATANGEGGEDKFAAFLEQLNASGLAEEVRGELERERDIQIEDLSHYPKNFIATTALLEDAEEAVRESHPSFSMPLDNEILRYELLDADSFSNPDPSTLSPEIRVERNKFQDTTARTACGIERLAVEMLDGNKAANGVSIPLEGEDIVHIYLQPKDDGNAALTGTHRYSWKDNTIDREDNRLRNRRLIVETIQRYADPFEQDPKKPFLGTLSLSVVYDFSDGEVNLVNTSARYHDVDSAKTGMEERFFDKHTSAEPESAITASEAREAFILALTYDALASAYPLYKERKDAPQDGLSPGVIFIGDKTKGDQKRPVTETQESKGDPDEGLSGLRRALFSHAAAVFDEVPYEEKQADPTASGEAYTTLLALQAKMAEASSLKEYSATDDIQAELDALINPSETDSDPLAEQWRDVRGLFGMPYSVFAGVHLIRGEMLLEEASKRSLREKLAQEKEARSAALRTDPASLNPINETRAYAVVEECARLGLDPKEFIAYGANEYERWRLKTMYAFHLNDAGQDTEHLFDEAMKELATNPKIAKEQAFMQIPTALSLTTDADTRRDLVDLFAEAMTQVSLTPDMVGAIFAVDKEVMSTNDTKLIRTYTKLINRVIANPTTHITDPGELHKLQFALYKGRFERNVGFMARKDTPTEDILTYISAAVDKKGYDRNAALMAAAEQFANRGDYARVQEFIGHLKPDPLSAKDDPAAIAYHTFWARAKTFGEMRMLNPYAQEREIPNITMFDYNAAIALTTEDVSLITSALQGVAGELRMGGNTVSELLHADNRWQLLYQLKNRLQEVAGKEDKQRGVDAAVDASRRVVDVFSTPGTTVEIGRLAPFFDDLAKHGTIGDKDTPGDWLTVCKLIIQNTPNKMEQAMLIARFGFIIEG